MPLYGKTYRMQWNDVAEKLHTVNIWDTLAPVTSGIPYNIAFTFVGEVDGNFLREFTWDALPVGTLGIRISFFYDLFGSETSEVEEFGPASPATTTTMAWMYIKKIIFEIKDADGNYSEVINLMDAGAAVAQVIPLEAAGNPWDVAGVDNDEDKFKVVRGKQATIRFRSTATISLSTFAASNSFDQRWYVEHDIDGRYTFKGFLILDDSSEPFLSPSNEVVLIAADGLGRLKSGPMLDFNDSNPRGFYTMAKYIAMCLRKTGLTLPINVVNNIKEESSISYSGSAEFIAPGRFIAPLNPLWQVGRKIKISNTALNNVTGVIVLVDGPIAVGPFAGQYNVYFDDALTPIVNESAALALIEDADSHIHNRIVLNAKTFEADINTSVNPYRGIEILLGESCFVTQEKGEWWIYREDELARAAVAKVNQYDADGVWVGETSTTFTKLIKLDESIWFSNNQGRVSLSQALKHIKHIYRYQFPREIICNIDFSRGDVITAPDLNAATSNGDYQLACWTMTGLFGYAVNSQAFIRRRFEYGYEKERYMVITPSLVDGGSVQVALAEPIDVNIKDKVTISVDFRRPENIGASEGNVGYRIMYVWLVDTNGKYWHWTNLHGSGGAEYKWIGPNGSHGNFPLVKNWVLSDTDEREWQDFSTEVLPFPASGKLYMGLMQQNWFTNFADGYDVHYQNFRFEYTPYLNGSYRQFTGHYYKVTQAANAEKYIPVRDEEVYIGQPPSKNFKGAMLIASGTNYVPAGRFYDSSLHPAPTDAQLKPYGEIIAYDVFNQFNREFRTFRGSLFGLTTDAVDAQNRADVPGLIHQYTLGDVSQHTTNKRFQLLGFAQDIKLHRWSGAVLKEIFDSTIEKVSTGIEFKYLEN